jgi:hypothetical protein
MAWRQDASSCNCNNEKKREFPKNAAEKALLWCSVHGDEMGPIFSTLEAAQGHIAGKMFGSCPGIKIQLKKDRVDTITSKKFPCGQAKCDPCANSNMMWVCADSTCGAFSHVSQRQCSQCRTANICLEQKKSVNDCMGSFDDCMDGVFKALGPAINREAKRFVLVSSYVRNYDDGPLQLEGALFVGDHGSMVALGKLGIVATRKCTSGKKGQILFRSQPGRGKGKTSDSNDLRESFLKPMGAFLGAKILEGSALPACGITHNCVLIYKKHACIVHTLS